MKTFNLTKAIVLLLIFASFGWVADSGTIAFKFIVYLSIATCSIYLITTRGGIEFDGERFKRLAILFAIFIAAQKIHGRSEEYNNLVKLLLCFLVACAIKNDEFYDGICSTAPYILYSSVIGWFCGILGLSFVLPDFVAETIRRVYYITPLGSVYSSGQEFRAHGIFWEPGVLALYCNLIILLKLFRYGLRLKSCTLEIIALILSGSAGGGLCLVFLMIINAGPKKDILDKIAFIGALFFIAIFSYGFFEYFDKITDVLNIFTSNVFGRYLDDDESFNTRSLDLYVPFMAASDSVYFGLKDIGRFFAISESIVGYSQLIITNSFGIIAYFYGYIFLLVYVYFMYKGIYGMLRISRRLSFLVMVLCLIVEPVQFSLVMFMIISTGESFKNDKI